MNDPIPLKFENVGTVSFPVTGIDDLAATRIQADGGSVNRQTEVCFISLPAGTQRKRLVSEPEPGHIIHKQSNRPSPDMLYKLPSGCVLRLSEHYLSYEGDGDEESEV